MHVHGSVTTRLLGPQLWATIDWQGALHCIVILWSVPDILEAHVNPYAA